MRWNPGLADLRGLDAVTSVGGDLAVSYQEITSLAGLGSLTSVGGDVTVYDNAYMATLSDLAALSSVGGDLYVELNASLCETDVADLVAQLSGFTGTVTTSGNTGECTP